MFKQKNKEKLSKKREALNLMKTEISNELDSNKYEKQKNDKASNFMETLSLKECMKNKNIG